MAVPVQEMGPPGGTGLVLLDCHGKARRPDPARNGARMRGARQHEKRRGRGGFDDEPERRGARLRTAADWRSRKSGRPEDWARRCNRCVSRRPKSLPHCRASPAPWRRGRACAPLPPRPRAHRQASSARPAAAGWIRDQARPARVRAERPLRKRRPARRSTAPDRDARKAGAAPSDSSPAARPAQSPASRACSAWISVRPASAMPPPISPVESLRAADEQRPNARPRAPRTSPRNRRRAPARPSRSRRSAGAATQASPAPWRVVLTPWPSSRSIGFKTRSGAGLAARILRTYVPVMFLLIPSQRERVKRHEERIYSSIFTSSHRLSRRTGRIDIEGRNKLYCLPWTAPTRAATGPTGSRPTSRPSNRSR
jgi:hypothetical protein